MRFIDRRIRVTEDDDKVLTAILEYWRRNPDDLAWLDKQDELKDIHDYRLRLWDDVNAMTDGALGMIVERGSLEWIFAVGVATAETLKVGRRERRAEA